jgi:hypothetical protein
MKMRNKAGGNWIILGVLASFLLFSVVFPNTFRWLTVPAFLSIGLSLLLMFPRIIWGWPLIFYIASVIVTMVYLIIGVIRTTGDFLDWIIFVYIIAPLVWLLIFSYFLRYMNVEYLVRLIIVYGIFGCASVYSFYFLYLNYGEGAVQFLIAEPNVELREGRVAATMHVYGSLIFITAGFLASPDVLVSRWRRVVVGLLLVITALISGRTALILAVAIGGIINFLHGTPFRKVLTILYVAVPMLFLVIGIQFFSGSISDDGSSIDFLQALSEAVEKIQEGGGEERVAQFEALIDGVGESFLLGSGHGVPASVIRNDVSPWKYELLWLSTLFHVGLAGLLVYFSPVIFVVACYFQLKARRLLNKYDVFMVGGYVAIVVACNTNPYLESFDFQWMVIMPSVYFYRRWLEMRSSEVSLA